MAPLVFQAPEGPAVGPGCFVRPWAAAAARPTGPSGALHTGGAWSLMCGSARRLVVRPGPAAAHGHRSQAHGSLRCPPHRWHLRLALRNFACNSPTALSKNELTTLESQRFQALLNLRPIELHATFLRNGHVAARGAVV